MKKKLLIFLLLLSLYSSVVFAAEVVVDFVDVGQGDAILIQTTAGAVVLIDGGQESAGRRSLVPFLHEANVGTINLMVATHPHSDHIGGLIPVLENFTVEKVYADAQIHTTRTYERFLLLIDQLDIPFYQVKAGMEVSLPGIDRFVFLHPQEQFLTGLNNNSVVIWMQVGSQNFLFTGDIESQAEQLLVASKTLPQAQVLKVAHHGSSTSSSSPFLAAIQPEIAIIMVGEDNTYSHPALQTLINLQGVEIYRTDYHGTITITTDGQTREITTRKWQVGLDYRINLNTASAVELQTVPGIGPVLAERIINYRNQYGFNQVGDLINISGIGAATLEKIKDYFYVD